MSDFQKSRAVVEGGFISSSVIDGAFKRFTRAFKSEIKGYLKAKDCELTSFNRGHFYLSGFFRNKEDQCFFFSISDVRFFGFTQILVREAEDENDYTGGANNLLALGDFQDRIDFIIE